MAMPTSEKVKWLILAVFILFLLNIATIIVAAIALHKILNSNTETVSGSMYTDALACLNNVTMSTVDVSNSSCPTLGQVLTATSSSSATWQTFSSSYSSAWTQYNTYNITDVTGGTQSSLYDSKDGWYRILDIGGETWVDFRFSFYYTGNVTASDQLSGLYINLLPAEIDVSNPLISNTLVGLSMSTIAQFGPASDDGYSWIIGPEWQGADLLSLNQYRIGTGTGPVSMGYTIQALYPTVPARFE